MAAEWLLSGYCMLGEKGQRGALERPPGLLGIQSCCCAHHWTRVQAQSETLSLRDGRKEFKMEGRKKGPWMGGIIGNGNKLNFPFCCVPVPSRCTSYSINHHTPSVHGAYFQSTFGDRVSIQELRTMSEEELTEKWHPPLQK